MELRNNLDRIPCEFSQPKANGKKVLLIAYKITVGQGSEPGAGWTSLLGHLKCGSKVHLISTSENILNLSVPPEYQHHVEFSTIDINKLKKRLLDKLPFSEQITYFFWNCKVRLQLNKKIKLYDFDIVHQSTFSGDWNPSCILWNLSSNLYWGPIGGSQKIPFTAYRWLGIKGILKETLRILITTPFRYLNRLLAQKNNVNVLVANKATGDYFSRKCKVASVSQIVLKHVSVEMVYESNSIPNRILSSGRLISWKMWPIAIRGVSIVNSKLFDYTIYGEGNEIKKLNKIIKKLAKNHSIKIKNIIPREKLLKLLVSSEVFLFSSLKDSSPWSLAEAIHLGIPIAAFNVSGISEMVNEPETNLASISGNLVNNFADKILNPYKVSERNTFCECKLKKQYEDIFYAN